MKKSFAVLFSLCLCTCAVFADVSSATKEAVAKYKTTALQAGSDAKAVFDALKEDIKKNGDRHQKAVYANVQTFAYVNAAPREFADVAAFWTTQLNEIGYDVKKNPQHAYVSFTFFIKAFNKNVTDKNIADAIADFNARAYNFQIGSYPSLTGMLIHADKIDLAIEIGDKLLKQTKINYQRSRLVLPYFNVLYRKDPETAAAFYLDCATKGLLHPAMVKNIDEVIATSMTASKYDADKFKAQLKRIRIVYTNKLTDEAGKKTWGRFVSVVDNTLKSL